MYLKFFFLLPYICQAEHVNFFDKIFKDNRAAPSTVTETIDNIRSDLGECRQRNLQLTNTLDYILEEMTEMKNKMNSLEQSFSRNDEKVENLQQSISEVKSTVEKYSSLNTNLEEDLVTVIEDNIERLDSLSYWGRWCAYQSAWDQGDSIITYEELLTHDNNMNVSYVPFMISSGTFVVPASGSWKINYNLRLVSLIWLREQQQPEACYCSRWTNIKFFYFLHFPQPIPS